MMKKSMLTLVVLLMTTLLLFGQAPGNVSTNMHLWLKANTGTTGTSPVTGWADQSGNSSNPTVNGNPQFQTNSFNYNPTVDLDGVGDYFSWNGLTAGFAQQGEIFSVHNIPTATPGVARELWNFSSDVFSGASHPYTNNVFYDDFGRDFVVFTVGNAFLSTVDVTKQYIYNTSGNATTTRTYVQGIQRAAGAGITGFPVNQPVTIGKGDWSGGVTKPIISNMGEIILYDVRLTAAERRRIWSYLAIKYGITLENTGGGAVGDYRSSNNTLIWDASVNPVYHNNIIGIGRDDDQVLTQKQSRTLDYSSKVYLSTLATTNDNNGGAFSSNNSYIVLGDDQGNLCATTASNLEMPVGCGLYSRIEREWKVTKTNITENFSMDITLNSCANLTTVDISNLRLLVDDDGDFSNGGTSCYFNGDGTGIAISYNNPTVTVSGISSVHIANNSTEYITLASDALETPLPISLALFDATCRNSETIVTWTTASEINNDFFTIERSIDGVDWEILEEINGAGNSSSSLNYIWYDEDPFLGVAYYRLKQTDFNGEFSYSDIQVVECKSNSVDVYPNPTENLINIVGLESELNNLKIYTVLGQDVTAQTKKISDNKSEVVIDLSNLSTGVYYVKTETTINKVYKQ